MTGSPAQTVWRACADDLPKPFTNDAACIGIEEDHRLLDERQHICAEGQHETNQGDMLKAAHQARGEIADWVFVAAPGRQQHRRIQRKDAKQQIHPGAEQRSPGRFQRDWQIRGF